MSDLAKASLTEGLPYPMGSKPLDDGVNFAIFSQHAVSVELCLFDSSGKLELCRKPLFGPHDGVFHGFLPGAQPGLIYGLRAHGPYEPHNGHRFNAHKLLLDPCAREIVGTHQWVAEHHGYCVGHADGPWSYDAKDNAAGALKARVAAEMPALTHKRPAHRTQDLVLYEVHVKGFSMTHPEIPQAIRGSYAALGHPAAIAHFKALGVTTLSLLPVQYALDEPALAARGSCNYWGYNTLGFCCPDPRLASQPGDPSAVRSEFREMVRALHQAGLEVVLDVVYNHTPEGNEWGPTLSFRGLDNASWYHLVPDDRSRCANISHCGNTLNVSHPRVTQFVLDSLRYWVQDMGVDGFRFDLAPVLGRNPHDFDPNAAFFVALAQDPVLARVHLISEPWDGGLNGYQVGRFPGRFLDWNDKFRDAVRGYWLRRGVSRGELAQRLTGSADLFRHHQRRPTASVNFITVHDGFTLTDLVSYSSKHNHANGEGNADGRDGELCANHGAEGSTLDPDILQRRDRVRRAMLATLLLAQGTPMLCAGDEIGKTQQGNNNAYCQDNALSWLNWEQADAALLTFVAQVVALRQREPSLRQADWFAPGSVKGAPARLSWRAPDGTALQGAQWHDLGNTAMACWMQVGSDDAGQAASLLLLLNPTERELDMQLPAGHWQRNLDSSSTLNMQSLDAAWIGVPSHSLLLLRQVSPLSPPTSGNTDEP